jgi:hypothetical protein
MRVRSVLLYTAALLVVASTLGGWLRPRAGDGRGEREAVVRPGRPQDSPIAPSTIAAPARRELQPALDRAFDRTVTLTSTDAPVFLAGDFNGDGATDLAALVRPRDEEARRTIAGGLTSWTIQDAGTARGPDADHRRPGIAAGERLLAVVHGVPQGGWRSPEARQSFLVRNAASGVLARRPLASLPAEVRLQIIRAHEGDVILTAGGAAPGVIAWTGAAYVWIELPS